MSEKGKKLNAGIRKKDKKNLRISGVKLEINLLQIK